MGFLFVLQKKSIDSPIIYLSVIFFFLHGPLLLSIGNLANEFTT